MKRIGYAVGVLLILAGLFHLVVFAIDGGPWEGPVSWRKPITFGLSFGLTLITVVWVSSYVRVRGALIGIFIADCVLEVAGITVQAWRGVPSHFNRESVVDSAVSTMLAVGGAVLIGVLVLMALQAFRPQPQLLPSMRIALRAGFVTMLIALASGAGMIARGVIAANTESQQVAYQVGGFLKPLHGVSLHGLLVLPALAWLLARLDWPESRRVLAVRAAIAAYALALVGAFLIGGTSGVL